MSTSEGRINKREEPGVGPVGEGVIDLTNAESLTYPSHISVDSPADWVTVRHVEERLAREGRDPVSMLLIDRQHHVERSEVYHRSVQILDTMQAVQQSSQWRLTFDPSTQKIVIHGLRIRRNAQIVEHAHPSRFRLLQREENLERLVLDGSVTLVVLLEDVRVGDVLDASFTIQTSPRLFGKRFTLLASAPEMIGVGEFSVSVRFSSATQMRWQSSSEGFSPRACEYGSEVEWLWRLDNLRPIVPESRVPSWHLPTHWLQVSDGLEWADVVEEFETAWGAATGSAELEKIVSEISSSAPDLAARADQAIALIQDEIRYLSVNTDFGGQVPSPPGVVFQRRFGDCKDKSFLLVHLLRNLGIPAFPVLVSSSLRQTIGKLLPTPAVFDHCIVGCDIDGRERWIDATLSSQGGGALGRQVPDFEYGLRVCPETTELASVPTESKRRDSYRLLETFRPDTTGGTSVIEVVVTATGLCADDLRRSIMLESAEAVAQSREEFYRRRYAGITRIGPIQWRDNRAANEFILADTFEIPNMLVPHQRPGVFALQCEAHLIQSVLALPGSRGRRFYPFDFSHPLQIEHWIDLDIPNIVHQGFQPQMFRSDAFQFWCETRKSAIHFNLRTHAHVITPRLFESHRATVEKAFPHTAVMFTIPAGISVSRRGRRPSSLSDSPSHRGFPTLGRSETGFKPFRPRQIQREGEGTRGSNRRISGNDTIASTGTDASLPDPSTDTNSHRLPKKNVDGHARQQNNPIRHRANTIPVWLPIFIIFLVILSVAFSLLLFR